MSKKLKLSIYEPCHENWENMNPVEQGKFCGSCQKQVVDFSTMSDRLVADFFKKPSTGSVCGRFMTDQLDRNIDIPRKRIPWIKYFFQILLPAFFISKAGAQPKMGTVYMPPITDTAKRHAVQDLMGKVSPRITPVCIKDTTTPMIKGEVTYFDPKRMITGKIMDQTGEPLPGASITIKGTRTGVSADNKGEFRISARKGDIVVVMGAGLEATETTVGANDNLNISVKRLVERGQEIIVVAGMISVDRTPERIKKLPKKISPKTNRNESPKDQQIIPVIPANDEIKSPFFTIFPNPVNGGDKISIECKKIETGNYSLQWIDQAGQLIKEQDVSPESKSGIIQTFVPSVTPGTYFMILTNKKTGKRYSQKVIVQ